MQFDWLWGYLMPIGLLLLVWGGLPPQKARRVTPLALFALALTTLAYWAVGFAFHLGGAHVVAPQEAALEGLNRLLPLIPSSSDWGFVGLSGFALSGDGVTPTVLSLFLAYLPLVATAVLLVVLALAEEEGGWMVGASLLFALLVWPVAACWTWGGGFLARLGQTMELGHGFVDFGGSALILWLPASYLFALLFWRERRPLTTEATLPPAHFPLLANAGAWVLGLGWMGWALALPFHTYGAALDWPRAALSMILASAGAVLTSQLYAYLAEGQIEPLLAARGAVAGWGASLAAAPFLTPAMALVTGLLAGLLFPAALYLVEEGLRLRDRSAGIALGLTGGLWGLLAAGLFAAGRWGAGWNGMATEAGAIGGLLGGDGGQLVAQLAGLTVLALWGGVWGSLLGLAPRFWQRLRQPPAPPQTEAPQESEAEPSAEEEEAGEAEEEATA